MSAAPIASPVAIARTIVGRSRYVSASHAAIAANATAMPSPVIGPVVHSMVPVVAANPPARPGAPARRAEATACGPHRERHRDAGEHGRDPRGVQRAEPEQVSRRTGSAGAAVLAARRPRGTGAHRAASRARWRRTRRRRRARGAARRTWGAGSPAPRARARRGTSQVRLPRACARRRSGHGHRKKVGGGCTNTGTPRGRFVRAPDAVPPWCMTPA